LAFRVLLISHGHPELSPGGAEIASYRLFQELRRRDGVDAFFVARTDAISRRQKNTPFSSFRGRPDEILISTGNTDQFLFSQRSNDLIDAFGALLTRIKPDVIHFHHYTQLGLELIAVARRVVPRSRLIVTLHEYLAICHHHGQMVKTSTMALCSESDPQDCAACFRDITPANFFRRELFIRAHFNKVDLFIAPSEFLRQRYIAWGIPSDRIVVLENAISQVQPPAPRPLAAGERRGMFSFFGQINPYKGLIQLLWAFLLLDQFPPEETRGLRLVVHGANLGVNHPKFIEAITQLLARAAHRVHFAGGYDSRDQSRLMAAVDWVVVPSIWWENSPLIIEEALAHRRPVICSNIGGMAEKVRPGKDGFQFAVGNPADLAGLLVRLAAGERIWEELQLTMRTPRPLDDVISRHMQIYEGAAPASHV
jgi:glycosyltransferase involved in cell wall biosynthesis